jgi:hypothetical protein
MSSRSAKDRHRIDKEIRLQPTRALIPCDYCFAHNKQCLLMASKDRKSLKCAECAKKGRPCVNLSWASLDRTREKASKALLADEERAAIMMNDLAKIQARIVRNRKVLQLAQERAAEKTICLIDEVSTEEWEGFGNESLTLEDTMPPGVATNLVELTWDLTDIPCDDTSGWPGAHSGHEP